MRKEPGCDDDKRNNSSSFTTQLFCNGKAGILMRIIYFLVLFTIYMISKGTYPGFDNVIHMCWTWISTLPQINSPLEMALQLQVLVTDVMRLYFCTFLFVYVH